jgi:hypothetical protein
MTVDPLRLPPLAEEAPPAAAPLAGGVLLVLALLPQAAARSAAASPRPSLAGTGTRPGIEMLMNIFSLSGGELALSGARSPQVCRSNYGSGDDLGLDAAGVS